MKAWVDSTGDIVWHDGSSRLAYPDASYPDDLRRWTHFFHDVYTGSAFNGESWWMILE